MNTKRLVLALLVTLVVMPALNYKVGEQMTLWAMKEVG